MGDPRKQRKKYSPPSHPWQAERIKEEKGVLKEFGLKNKTELWKANSTLKNFKAQAKKLITRTDEQASKEEELFMQKLAKLNILAAGAKIEDVLDLSINDILERRLQTQVVRKGIANTPKQARQMIVHGHVMVKNKKVNVPSYLVTVDEEHLITFNPNSKFADEEHPERVKKKKELPQKKEEQISEDKEFIDQISKGEVESKGGDK